MKSLLVLLLLAAGYRCRTAVDGLRGHRRPSAGSGRALFWWRRPRPQL